MRRLAATLAAATLLLQPVAALAVFEQPADLLLAMQQQQQSRTFSSELHGRSGDTYFAMWLSGEVERWQEPEFAKMRAKATVDVAKGPLKVRVKLEAMLVDQKVFVKLAGVDGSFVDMFASVTGAFEQKQWVQIPLEERLIEEWKAMTTMSMFSDALGSMFEMRRTAVAGGHSYALTLSQEGKDELRSWMSSSAPGINVVDTGMTDVTVTIVTTGTDEFLRSDAIANWSVGDAEVKVASHEARLSRPLAVTAPADSMTLEQVMRHFESLEDMSLPFLDDMPMNMRPMSDDMMTPDMPDMEIDRPTRPGPDFDAVEPESDSDARCDDPYIDALLLVQLQRTGECPVEKARTRR